MRQLFVNIDGGIEHLIVVDEDHFDAEDVAEGEVVVALFTAGLPPQLLSDTAVLFREDGRPGVRYRGLFAFDAQHRRQGAWFELDGSTVEVHITVDSETEWPVTIDPIAQSASPSFTIAASDSWFGFAMAVADVDGDGDDDLLVGAPDYSGGSNDEGRVYLIKGTSSGLDTANATTFEPNVASAQCGESVVLGDVTGEGRVDVLYGCPGESSNDGRIRVHAQASDGTFPSSPSYTLSDNSGSGTSLGREGTLAVANLNGQDELEVVSCHPGLLAVWNLDSGTTPDTSFAINGARQIVRMTKTVTASSFEGVAVASTDQVRVYNGRTSLNGFISSGDSTTVNVETGVVPGTIAAGDLNGDELTDLLVGTPGGVGGGSNGGATLFLNGDGSFSSLTSYTGSGGEEMGSAVLLADLNNDSFPETIICASRALSGKGRCLVREGTGTSPYVGTTKLTAEGEAVGDHLGAVTPTAGDFREDGGKDFTVASFEKNSNTGTVYVYDGDRSTLESIGVFSREMDETNSSLGQVVVMYDVNNDGNSDVLVGAPGYDSGGTDKGAVFLWSGASLDYNPEWTQVGSDDGENFGSSIAVGEFINDAAPPVIVIGAPANDDVATNAGKAYAFQAPANGFPSNNATANNTFAGTTINDQFGHAIANARQMLTGAGDTLVISAPQLTKGTGASADGGYIKFYFPNGDDIEFHSTVTGENSPISCTSSFGSALAGVGDVVNGEGDDLLVGADECDDGSTNEGKAFLLYEDDGSVSITSWSFQVNQAEAHLGVAVAAIGDATGDGVADFAVGAPLMDNTSCSPSTVTDAGRVYFFKGVSSGVPSTTQTVSLSTCTSSNMGSAIAGNADFNHDGLKDMILGAPLYDGANTNEGRATVYHGKPGSMETTAFRIFEGNCDNCVFGTSIATGDVNEDGYGDAVIGRPGRSNGHNNEGSFHVFLGVW